MSSEHENLVRAGARFYADTLREKGWCQGSYSTLDGRYCLWGVMLYGGGGVRVHGVERLEIARRARRLAGAKHLIEWNDEPGRTADEVIGLFDRIANGEGA